MVTLFYLKGRCFPVLPLHLGKTSFDLDGSLSSKRRSSKHSEAEGPRAPLPAAMAQQGSAGSLLAGPHGIPLSPVSVQGGCLPSHPSFHPWKGEAPASALILTTLLFCSENLSKGSPGFCLHSVGVLPDLPRSCRMSTTALCTGRGLLPAMTWNSTGSTHLSILQKDALTTVEARAWAGIYRQAGKNKQILRRGVLEVLLSLFCRSWSVGGVFGTRICSLLFIGTIGLIGGSGGPTAAGYFTQGKMR